MDGRMDASHITWFWHQYVGFLIFVSLSFCIMYIQKKCSWDCKTICFCSLSFYLLLIGRKSDNLVSDDVWLTTESSGAQDRIWTNLKDMPSTVDLMCEKKQHGGKLLFFKIVSTFLIFSLPPILAWPLFPSYYSPWLNLLCLIEMDMHEFKSCLFTYRP